MQQLMKENKVWKITLHWSWKKYHKSQYDHNKIEDVHTNTEYTGGAATKVLKKIEILNAEKSAF